MRFCGAEVFDLKNRRNMNLNDVINYLKAALRGAWRIIGKIKDAVEIDGIVTLFFLIAWIAVQNSERDVIKTVFIWLMSIAAIIALVVRWVQTKYRTRSAATLHKDAKEQVRIFNRMGFTLALLCVIFFVFRHLLKYGPEMSMEIVVAVVMVICVTMMTIITKTSDRT